jgi:hypothetical protein
MKNVGRQEIGEDYVKKSVNKVKQLPEKSKIVI